MAIDKIGGLRGQEDHRAKKIVQLTKATFLSRWKRSKVAGTIAIIFPDLTYESS
jgi:hypothetical protein